MAQSAIRRPMRVIGLATCALLLAACARGAGTGATASSASSAAAGPSVSVGQTVIGAALTGANGKTLYQFAKDQNGTSACTGDCASNWPPFTLGANEQVQAASGVTMSFASIKRDDGSTQATYAGHPLYYFVADSAAGDVKGEGSTAYGGKWFAESPSGGPVKASSSSSSAAASASASPSSSGYSTGGY